ncbi:glycosidase crf2 [Apiospora arundinis]
MAADMMSSSDEVMSHDSASTKVGNGVYRDGPWQGQSPCVCHYRQGCDQHNPHQKPIRHNPSLLPKKPWYSSATESILRRTGLRSTTSTNFDSLMSSFFLSNLPFDFGSITPLPPIHEAIPYHLAFYHLDSARRRLNPNVEVAFIPELSCHGLSSIKSRTARDMPFTWSSEIYFGNGTFLQKQELMYTMDTQRTFWPSTTVNVCSHRAVRLQLVRVQNNDGIPSVSMLIKYPPFGRWVNDFGSLWNSAKGGSKNDLLPCPKCPSDLGYHVESIGREFQVRFTCCRDLGAATERHLPKWQTLLTGEGSYILRPKQYLWQPSYVRMDEPSHYERYKHVLEVAKSLDRPNLHRVTYMTAGGELSTG